MFADMSVATVCKCHACPREGRGSDGNAVWGTFFSQREWVARAAAENGTCCFFRTFNFILRFCAVTEVNGKQNGREMYGSMQEQGREA